MIDEQNINVIVMLTPLVQEGMVLVAYIIVSDITLSYFYDGVVFIILCHLHLLLMLSPYPYLIEICHFSWLI